MPGISDLVAGLPRPAFQRAAEMVSMVHPDEYPMNLGDLASTSGRTFDAGSFEEISREIHVEHSNALHATLDGEPYLVGPMARYALHRDKLSPQAREAAAELDGRNREGVTPLGIACAAGNWARARSTRSWRSRAARSRACSSAICVSMPVPITRTRRRSPNCSTSPP